MAKFKLVVVGGDAQASEIVLSELPALVGRGREADIRLAHPLVSRLHCELYLFEETLHVRDLGSLNGTFVGNVPVKTGKLPDGELLTIGTVTFRALLHEPAPVGGGDITELPVDENLCDEPGERTMSVGQGESTISTSKESAKNETTHEPLTKEAIKSSDLPLAADDLQKQDARVPEGQNLPIDDA